jgi:Pentapeptide repeats (8 copies)
MGLNSPPPTWPEWKPWIGRRWWLYPLARIEWTSEWAYYSLRKLAFFDLLDLAGRTAVLVIAIFWVLEAGDRAKERHYRAWDLINAARGSTGDGGRRDAVQDLNEDDVSLAAAPLGQAWLPYINLQGADLSAANLQEAFLGFANLQRANLGGADLQADARWSANLQGGLTQEQLNAANGDDRTQLPEGLARPAHWSRFEGNVEQSGAAQPGGAAPCHWP